MKIVIYQTLKDKNNPDEIEEYGPFPCRRPNAWLGDGYYFWDTFIDLAHWWGQKSLSNSYIVCEGIIYKDHTCWDLHGDGSHLQEFEDICWEIVDSGISSTEKLLVPQVIEFIKKKGQFKYKAIRALGVDSITNWFSSGIELLKIRFNSGKKPFLNLRPAVQVCLVDKQALSLQGFRIVYPDEYLESYI